MINSDTAKKVHTTVAEQTNYPVGFQYYWNVETETPQLTVTLDDVELLYGDGYTTSGGDIVLSEEPEAGLKLVITRNVPFTQKSDYVIGRIDPDQIERDFDLATMRAQQTKQSADTAVEIVYGLKDDVENAVDVAITAAGSAEESAEIVAGYETRMTNVENGKVDKSGDTMTGVLKFHHANSGGAIEGESNGLKFSRITPSGTLVEQFRTSTGYLYCCGSYGLALGTATYPILNIYTPKINNGYDIDVPVTSGADILALKSEVNLAANSGTQLRDKGVWYAKMNSATTPPVSAEVEGRNYADFTQVDQSDNPIIVIYTYTSGAWAQTETITPPAAYNGYLPITSKIWDIPEQTGQQGGQVLWSYSAKTFTPYPRIISTDGIAITNSTFSNGSLTNTTTTMPTYPLDETVVNKKYVDDALQAYLPDLFDTKWKDYTMTRAGWKVSDGNWIEKSDGAPAYEHLVDDIDGKSLQSETIGSTTVQFYLADDGHKVCPASEESNVAAIYATTGVAWYYVLDTVNEQFKLPRTHYGFVGSRGNVGNYVEAGLPNITGSISEIQYGYGGASGTGAFSVSQHTDRDTGMTHSGGGVATFAFSAQDSNSIYGNSTTVQPPATEMYLYFYVGV